MRKSIFIVAVVTIMASGAMAQEAVRMLGTHQHGHGTVNLAIEGNRVLIELHAPGADIVGFEHPARSETDRQAVDEARSALRNPLSLFAMPADAQCRVEKANVALAGDTGHEHEKEHGQAGREEHQHKHEHAQAERDAHMEFHAEYALLCDRPAMIRTVGLPFFKLFPRSRELKVTVITGRGQTAYEVERDRPMFELNPAP